MKCAAELTETYDHMSIEVTCQNMAQRNKSITLEELIRQNFELKINTNCRKCKTWQLRKIDQKLNNRPKYIALSIQRNIYQKKKKTFTKCYNEIEIKSTLQFDLNKSNKGDSVPYKVVGGAVHQGSGYSGHYFALFSHGNEWFKVNDERAERVTEATALKLLSKFGTMLLMEKLEVPLHEITTARLEKEQLQVPSNRSQKNNSEKVKAVENNSQNFFRVYRGGKAWWKFYIRKHDQTYDPDKKAIYTKRPEAPGEAQN